jgi:hypothetical protein
MNSIRQIAGEHVEFIGVGDTMMANSRLKKAYAYHTADNDKPFYPYKNFYRENTERVYHPLMAPLTLRNRSLINQVLNKHTLADSQFSC